jgi:AcrR family transcriptional regulator
VRARKSNQTRERIIEATGELLAERGSADFQMGDIASRCEMSNGALYYYFPDRDSIVAEVFSRHVDAIVETIERVVSDARSAHDALHELCVELAGGMRGGKAIVTSLASELSREGPGAFVGIGARLARVVHLVEVQVERAKIEGAVRDDVDPAAAACYICGAFLGAAVEMSARGGDAFDVEGFADELTGFIVHGVARLAA